jgi:hypothetical protein
LKMNSDDAAIKTIMAITTICHKQRLLGRYYLCI